MTRKQAKETKKLERIERRQNKQAMENERYVAAEMARHHASRKENA
tara:strand:+ start:242 stop:379 length:138 start_codon:yes stop_codon:yes gene_type:complete